MCRLHFYNTPITGDFTEASHPLNIIRSICEPGDFIAVKLDIDNGPLETAIMAEIAADPGLRHCISEMFYEQHYNHAGPTSIHILCAAKSRATSYSLIKQMHIKAVSSRTCLLRHNASLSIVRVCLQTWLMPLVWGMAQPSAMLSEPLQCQGNLECSFTIGHDSTTAILSVIGACHHCPSSLTVDDTTV